MEKSSQLPWSCSSVARQMRNARKNTSKLNKLLSALIFNSFEAEAQKVRSEKYLFCVTNESLVCTKNSQQSTHISLQASQISCYISHWVSTTVTSTTDCFCLLPRKITKSPLTVSRNTVLLYRAAQHKLEGELH